MTGPLRGEELVLSAWELARGDGDFRAVKVPCTVASALRERGEWSLGHPAAFDEERWTFRCRFPASDADVLVCDGLTPNTEVWLNGARLAVSENMFVPLEVPLKLQAENLLELRCLPLGLASKRGRPRWRTALLDDQKRRFVRATAIGHMPSWGPSFATVGPWRQVALRKRLFASLDVRVHLEGSDGVVELRATPVHPGDGELRLLDERVTLRGAQWSSTVRIANAERWWPHTHGAQPRYPLSLTIGDSVLSAGVAFRTIVVGDDCAVRVNGEPIFCRGACWTPSDPISLGADPLPALHEARAANFNMLRVSGNTFYESDAFYEACDALGILVWQDFAFASLDYPFADQAFMANVSAEASAFLQRTQARASLAVVCGNSEVEMQPALLAQAPVPQPFFHEVLPALTEKYRPGLSYVGSSPSHPSQPRSGFSHYYGIGAYQRPLSDARLSGVRFATECLGFAQRPGLASQEAWHDEPWVDRVVRAELGVGDFVDVHDFYLREHFKLDPLALRACDRLRYHALSEILPGEVMEKTFAEWRTHGHCHGALIWFLRDGWRSCGWGLIDADGRPKAAYHYLRRVLAPRAVLVSDEGLNGLDIHLLNEHDTPYQAELTVELYRESQMLERFSQTHAVAARGHRTLAAETVLGRFTDLTHAYRFGARPCDTVVVRWGDTSPVFHFLNGAAPPEPRPVGLTATRTGTALHIYTRDFARSVILECQGASDNYFHLAPRQERIITIPDAPVRLTALNATESVRTT